MDSKRLKAIVAKGDRAVPIVDKEAVDRMRKEYLAAINNKEAKRYEFLQAVRKCGTSSHASLLAHSGDSSVKNWGGVGVVDFPDVSGIEPEAVIANLDKHVGCWHCPMVCEGSLKEGTGEYKYVAGSRRPEYETLASFGSMCLNNHTESIAMANYICNRYGIDTISAGTAIAFTLPGAEGVIKLKDKAQDATRIGADRYGLQALQKVYLALPDRYSLRADLHGAALSYQSPVDTDLQPPRQYWP